jgi:hypothetical protein
MDSFVGHLQFLVQPAFKRIAMTLTANGLFSHTGWVELGDYVTDYTTPELSTYWSSGFGGITITDNLTDAQIEAAEETGVIPPGIVIPSYSSILPGSTAKVSHARLLAVYRSQQQAQAFHEIMRSAT